MQRMAMAIGLSLGMLAPAVMAAAQDATPAGEMGGPPLAMPEGCSVVASGLLNPRYVAVAGDGTIYVSEAGTGGDEVIDAPVMMEGEGGTPPADAAAVATPVAEAGADAAAPAATRGDTGRVTAISPDGTQSVLVDGLPSYKLGGPEITGPGGIAVAADGSVILAIGGASRITPIVEALENENSVVSIDPATGEVTLLANIDAYERASNPDPYNVDSNLYGVAIGDDGTIFVNDAGGNTTYRVPAGGGEPEVLAVHPGLALPEGMQGPPGGNTARGGAMELDPVPTDILTTADGGVLVGLLSGGPFPVGAAKVVSVSADGTITDLALGLTMVVAVEAGPDGQLYVTQFSTNFLGEMPEPGNVTRVSGDGTQEIVVDGLMLPNGIAFEADGSLLVVVMSTSPAEPMGMLLRCDIGAAPAAGIPALDMVRARGFTLA
jgi:hypothetical protein